MLRQQEVDHLRCDRRLRGRGTVALRGRGHPRERPDADAASRRERQVAFGSPPRLLCRIKDRFPVPVPDFYRAI